MGVLTIRRLDDELIRALKQRAAGRGRSAEAEARAILAEALGRVSGAEAADLVEQWLARVRGRGGPDAVELIREGRDEDLM